MCIKPYGIGSTTVIWLLLFYYCRSTFPIKYLRPSLSLSLSVCFYLSFSFVSFMLFLTSSIYLICFISQFVNEKRTLKVRQAFWLWAKQPNNQPPLCVYAFCIHHQYTFQRMKYRTRDYWRGTILSCNTLRYKYSQAIGIWHWKFSIWKIMLENCYCWSIRVKISTHTNTNPSDSSRVPNKFKLLMWIGEWCALTWYLNVHLICEKMWVCVTAIENAKPIPFSIVYMNECNQL